MNKCYSNTVCLQVKLKSCNCIGPLLLVDLLWNWLKCVLQFRFIRVLDDICLRLHDGTNSVQPAMELSELRCCDLVSSVQLVPSWLTSGNCIAPSWRLAINLSGRNQVLQSEVTMLIMIKWNQIIYIFQSHRLAGNWLNCGGCCDQTLQS